jgi:putative transposase
MPNTYTQIYIHVVFAVQNRSNLISEKHREEIEKYICGILRKKNCKPLAIYLNPDHIHIFLGLHPNVSVSDITRDIKANSSKFINEKRWIAGKFNWQDGFGAFTISKSQIDVLVKYILNQPIHHGRKTFKEEYFSLLKEYDVEFDERYLFEWYD